MQDRKEYQKQWNLKNKDRIKQDKQEYYAENKEAQRNRDLLSRYGISTSDYEEMLKEQNNSCACCGITVDTLLTKYPKSFHGSLVVDHDHETGKVRELLCSKCNTLVGYLEKRKELIPKAYEYINKHK